MSTFINAPKIPPLPPEKENERLIADALWTITGFIVIFTLVTLSWALLIIAY